MANSGAYAPRASLIAPGVNPSTGAVNAIKPTVSTVGTDPATFTGGRQGLEQAIAMQKANQNQNALTSEIALRKAQTGEAEGRTASMGVNSMANIIRAQAAQNKASGSQAGTLQKQQAALQKQQAAENEHNADTLEKLQKDVDSVWGAGSAQTFLQGMQQGVHNSGKIVGTGDSAQWVGDPNGPMVSINPSTTGYQAPMGAQGIPADSAQPYASKVMMQPYVDRFNHISKAPNGRYVQPMPNLQQKPAGPAPPGNPNAGSIPTGGGDVPQTPGQLNIAGPNGQPMQMPGTEGGQPAQGGGSTPQVQSKQDPAYLALPSGAQYMDPNGVLRTKS